jgi:hypothetical protein
MPPAFIATNDKPLPVVAMCVCNPDRSPIGINRGDAAPTPTSFAEIVGDDFPIFHFTSSMARFEKSRLIELLFFRR